MHFQSSHFRFRYFASHHFVRQYTFAHIGSGVFVLTGEYIKVLDGNYINVPEICFKDSKLKILDNYYQSLSDLKNINEIIEVHSTIDNSICNLTDEESKKYKFYNEMLLKLNKIKQIIPINK